MSDSDSGRNIRTPQRTNTEQQAPNKQPTERLQRPLHRLRGRPRTSPLIRDTEELKALLGCSKAQLPERLRQHGIGFHRDSTGNYWAALDSLPDADAQDGD